MRLPRPSTLEPLEARIAPAFAAVVDLPALDGTHGFKLNGAEIDDRAGSTVNNAGDLNGDGLDDVVIAAPQAANYGACYVAFGHRGEFPGVLELSALDGQNGFKVDDLNAGGVRALSAGSAGDVNGDGFGDLVIGSPGGNAAGAAYVIFGHAGGFAPVLDVANLDGANGFAVEGESVFRPTQVGRSVSGAGDINGDGFDDVLIGAPGDAHPGSYHGAAFVIFGHAGPFPATLALSQIDGSNGFRIQGAAHEDVAGSAVSGAGDLNGDGFDDLLIGAPFAETNGQFSGSTYVVFGKAAGFGANFDTAMLDGTNGFTVVGEEQSDMSGYSVSRAGDVNGDGFGDLLIGAHRADNFAGAGYIVFGHSAAFVPRLDLADLDGANGFKLRATDAAKIGFSVSGAGDVNGDGFDDIIVGGFSQRDPVSGASYGPSYVFFGKAARFTRVIDLAELDGASGFKLTGHPSGRTDLLYSGISYVGAAGDVNGDGFADVIVGLPYAGASYDRIASGVGYVIFGQPAAPPPPQHPVIAFGAGRGAEPAVRVYDPATQDFVLSFLAYDAGDHGGVHVTFGDIDGDGSDDLITANRGTHIRAFDSHSGAPLMFGGVFPELQPFGPDWHGGAQLAAGDLDGDGTDEIIVASHNELAVLDATTGATLSARTPFHAPYTGGVNVAVADVNGDHRDDIIVAKARAGGAVKVFSGADGTVLLTIHPRLSPFPLAAQTDSLAQVLAQLADGSSVAAGDLDGDGRADIITGSTLGSHDRVEIFAGRDGAPLMHFAPFGSGFASGVRLAADDLNADGVAEIIAAAGPGGGGAVRIFDGANIAALVTFTPFPDFPRAGVAVAAGSIIGDRLADG